MSVTGSGLERAMHCPASCALPRAGHTGEAALVGNTNHSQIESGDRSRPVVGKVLDSLQDVRHEVAYALDTATCSVREIGVNIGRQYGDLSPSEIALTVDLEGREGSTWWCVDWKSRERVTSAVDNWQVRAGTMAVMLRHRAHTGAGAIAYLDNGELDAAPFDSFHVAGWWSDLGWLLTRIRDIKAKLQMGHVPDVSAGPWCKYCPALPHCPAHTRLALALLGELDGIDAAVAGLTVERCGRAWALLKRYDVIADRIRESIRERARREFIPVGNGRRLALIESQRTSLDTKRAAEMLGEGAPYKTTTYTQVREVNTKDGEGD